ncbi:MAG: branched-chain amino acid ABC transporter permease [Betaproteobacteria bacterium]|nr:branched-chain amino acid ABC transporter permease [Betaproteobacteria bacterium]
MFAQEFAQHLVDGLIVGAIIALPALGLTLIFSVLGFANFALAAHATLGAYAAYWVNVSFGWPIAAGLLAAFVAAGALGLATDAVALKRLRQRGGADTALTVAIVSIALNIALESVARFFFGNDLRSYNLPILRDIRVGQIHVNPQQLENLFLALAVMALLFAFFGMTRAGKAMRAVADNPDLARLKGIAPERVARAAIFAGMGLAGVGGMLIGLDASIDPLTGGRILLTVFAASVVGGLTSIPGAVAGAFLIGVAEELALIVIAPTYKSAIGFVAIVITLALRPQGLFGRPRA